MSIVCFHKCTHCVQYTFRFSIIQDMTAVSGKTKGNNNIYFNNSVILKLQQSKEPTGNLPGLKQNSDSGGLL